MDVNCKVIYIDVRANGAGFDSGIFNNTELKRRLEANTLVLPVPEPLVPVHQPLPYFLTGDNALL